MRSFVPIVPLIIALFLCGCTTPPKTADGVLLRFTGYAEDGHSELLFFELANLTDQPVWFQGFDINTPLFEIHRQNGQGSEQVDSAMSATGSGPQALGAGQKTTFVLTRYFHDVGSFWLEIGLSTLDVPEERTIRSDSFTLGQSLDY